jgi:hypothetical protein
MKGGFLIDETKQEEFIRVFGEEGRARLEAIRTTKMTPLIPNKVVGKALYTKIIRYLLTTPDFTVTLMSYDSAYGFIFKVTVPYDKTFFKMFQSAKETYVPITEFLIKMTILTPDHEKKYIYAHSPSKSYPKLTNKPNEFQTEAYVQHNAYVSYPFDNSYVAPLLASYPLEIPIDGDNGARQIKVFEDIFKKIQVLPPDATVGLICMQMMSGFRTLDDIEEDKRIPDGIVKKMQYLAAAMLLFFTYDTAYVHQDAHFRNLMGNPNYVGFLYKDEKGKIVIIDFGKTQLVKADDYTKYTRFFKAFLDKKEIKFLYVAIQTILHYYNTKFVDHGGNPYIINRFLDILQSDIIYKEHMEVLAPLVLSFYRRKLELVRKHWVVYVYDKNHYLISGNAPSRPFAPIINEADEVAREEAAEAAAAAVGGPAAAAAAAVGGPAVRPSADCTAVWKEGIPYTWDPKIHAVNKYMLNCKVKTADGKAALVIMPDDMSITDRFLESIPKYTEKTLRDDGIYTWLLYSKAESPETISFAAVKVKNGLEVGTMHIAIARAVHAHKIHGSGEIRKKGNRIEFNTESGTYVAAWMDSRDKTPVCSPGNLEKMIQTKFKELFTGTGYDVVLNTSVFITPSIPTLRPEDLDEYRRAGFIVEIYDTFEACRKGEHEAVKRILAERTARRAGQRTRKSQRRRNTKRTKGKY